MTIESTLHAWVVSASEIAADRVLWANQPGVPIPANPGAWISLNQIANVSGGHGWLATAVNPLALPAGAWVADATANTLTLAAHGLLTGDGPVRLLTTGTLPAPLALATDYWIIKTSANAVQLAATFLESVETPTPIDLTDIGTGNHTMAAVAASDDTMGTVRAGAEITRTTQGTRTGTLSVQCFGGAAVGSTSSAGILEKLKARTLLPTIAAALRAGAVGIGWLGDVRDVSAKLPTGTFEPRAVLDVRFHAVAPEHSATDTVIDTLVATGTVT